MRFQPNISVKHLFILGAGASADYGLPVWNELVPLIEQKVKSDDGKSYNFGKEILEWTNKVGNNKEYQTIDHCIEKESRSKQYRSNGLRIENEIFQIMKDIFHDRYKDNEDGWIDELNRKILGRKNLEHELAFINYNYDSVLDENFFRFEYLSEKELIVDHGARINKLLQEFVSCFYPHGNFYSEREFKNPNYFFRVIQTKKSDNGTLIDAISCQDCEKHEVRVGDYGKSIKIHILGLGRGLETNLNNIEFLDSISEINITIRDKTKKEEIVDFLCGRFRIQPEVIKIYSDCNSLIKNCL